MGNAPEFLEGDRATRLKVLGFAGVLLLLILLDHLTSPDRGMLATDPVRAFRASSDRLFLVAMVAVPLFAGAAIYLLRLGVRVSQSGQYPPPGMRLAMRTRIRRGMRARAQATLAIALAAILIVVSLVLIYASYSLSRLAHELGPPNKQMQPTPRHGAADLRRWADGTHKKEAARGYGQTVR